MRSRDLVRIARDRAGLTQDQLAARSGRPRETIARWEAGTQEPSLAALQDLVDACELELVLNLARRDTSLHDGTSDQLGLKPMKRLASLLPNDRLRDVTRGLRWLAKVEPRNIVIGSIAAALHGGPQRPQSGAVEFVAEDPVAIETELRRVGATPVDVDDRWRDTDVRAPWDLKDGGTVVLTSKVPGTRDYRDLRRAALSVDLGNGRAVWVAHPRDLLRIADASSNEADRARVPGLRALLDEVG